MQAVPNQGKYRCFRLQTQRFSGQKTLAQKKAKKESPAVLPNKQPPLALGCHNDAVSIILIFAQNSTDSHEETSLADSHRLSDGHQ